MLESCCSLLLVPTPNIPLGFCEVLYWFWTCMTCHPASGISLPVVAAHEFGHALGLSHSPDPGSIMYPAYNFAPSLELSFDDVKSIQHLYGERESEGLCCVGCKKSLLSESVVCSSDRIKILQSHLIEFLFVFLVHNILQVNTQIFIHIWFFFKRGSIMYFASLKTNSCSFWNSAFISTSLLY